MVVFSRATNYRQEKKDKGRYSPCPITLDFFRFFLFRTLFRFLLYVIQ